MDALHWLRRPSKTKRASKLFETLWRCCTCVSWNLGTKAGARFVWDILTKYLWLSMSLIWIKHLVFGLIDWKESINVEDDWISGEISISPIGNIVCHFWPTPLKSFYPTKGLTLVQALGGQEIGLFWLVDSYWGYLISHWLAILLFMVGFSTKPNAETVVCHWIMIWCWLFLTKIDVMYIVERSSSHTKTSEFWSLLTLFLR